MISEEEKERIKREEIFRVEVKKSLEQTNSKSLREKAWTTFNSPFGLWVLSTVVVGLVVFFYNDLKLKSEMTAASSALTNRISTETSHRLQKFRLALSAQNPYNLYYENTDLAYMLDGTLMGDGRVYSEKPVYIFPEYKDRTMHSLLYELERLTDDESLSQSIREARNVLNQITTKLLNMEEPPQPGFSLSQRISSIAQTQPENLTTEDSITLKEYSEKLKQFEQNELSEYQSRMKSILDSLNSVFNGNPFLKELSIE